MKERHMVWLGWFALIIILIGFLCGHAYAADWPNEPAGSERLVDCNLSSSRCAGQVKAGTFYDLYNLPIVSDTAAPMSPPSVGMAKLLAGQTIGGGQIGWYDAQRRSDLYMGVMFKLNADYGCSLPGKSKTFFLRTYENKGDALKTNGVFFVEGCGEMKKVHWSHNTGGLDHRGKCDADLGLTCQPNVGPGLIKRGAWAKIEACISGDGTLKWWVDEQPAGSYTGLQQGSVFNEWVWNQTWDGAGNGQGFTRKEVCPGQNCDAIQYLDHVVLSVPPPGGCRGTSTPPVQPAPGTILNLKVTVTP